MNKMKTLILTEGGKGRGFGHLSRCAAIAQALRELGPSCGVNFVVEGDEDAMCFLAQQDVDAVRFDWKSDTARVLAMSEKSDPILIDSFLAEEEVYRKISGAKNGRLLMIDDYKRLDYPAGVVVNPSIYGDNMGYSPKAGTEHVGGRDYIVLRKPFWDAPRKDVSGSLKSIMLTFGFTEDPAFVEDVSGHLRKSTGLRVDVVDTGKKSLGAEDMLELMLRADICVSAGGQTTNELARVGVPSIGVCFAENQIFNLRGWHSAGVLEFIGWNTDKGMKRRLSEAVERLSSREERKRRSGYGRSIVDGMGAGRIAGRLVEMAGVS